MESGLPVEGQWLGFGEFLQPETGRRLQIFWQCEITFCYKGMMEEQFQRLHQMIQKKESTSENVEKEKEVMTKSLTEVDSAHIARDSREKSKLRRGWDVSREQHRNMYIIYGETYHQPRLVA